MSEVPIEIKNVIVDQLGVAPEKVQLSSTFVDDLGADSLDIVELVMEMEEQFSVEIPDDEAEKLKSVQDVVSFIQKEGKLNS